MQYITVTEPKWADPGHTLIDCLVQLSDRTVPFTASPSDPEHHYVGEICARCIAGDFGLIGPYVAPVKSPERLAAEAAQAAHIADLVAAKGYAKLRALSEMTPVQVQSWVEANVNSLADAKDALKTLAVAVSVLARRL